MHLVRIEQAPGYDAPGHQGMAMRCLQGRQAGPSDSVWIGMSVLAPDGGAVMAASPLEKFYVVLDGEVEIGTSQGGAAARCEILRRHDSCRIAPGEARQLVNRSRQPATILLIMPQAT